MESPKELVAVPWRQKVTNLQILCGIQVLKDLHGKAKHLRNDYFEEFSLKLRSRSFEPAADIRPETGIEPAAFVDEFEARLKAKEERDLKAKKNVKSPGETSRRDGLRDSTKRQRRQRPYDVPSTSNGPLMAPLQSNAHFGVNPRPTPLSFLENCGMYFQIPSGFAPTEYVKYRKCKLVQDIQYIRGYLQQRLNCRIIRNLMSILENIQLSNNLNRQRVRDEGRECVIQLILSAFLLNSEACSLNLKPLRLWGTIGFCRLGGSLLNSSFLKDNEVPNMELRMETMIISYGLISASNLTSIQMSGAANDPFLKIIAEVCGDTLKFLDISDSHVSNKGLYALAGVTEEQSRASKYARKCKNNGDEADHSNNGSHKCLVKTKKGCWKLTHLVAYCLRRLTWSQHNDDNLGGFSNIGFINIINSQNNNNGTSMVKCPKDSGFLMILKHLPNLQVLLNEKGGKIMETVLAERKRQKIPALTNLQVISDHQMNKNVMKAILTMAPNLKSIILRTDQRGKDESWLEALSSAEHNIQSVVASESAFKGPNLVTYLLEPVNGAKLRVLDVRELCFFRLSWLQKIKLNCQNLQKLILGINTRMTIHALHFHQIDIINDFNLGNGDGKVDPDLKHLELLHIHGPFGPEVTSYLIKGATHLTNLALLIEWMDANFLSVQPDDKDYLGVDYLKEVLKVNALTNVTQLHLSGGFKKRNKTKLDKNCLEFVLSKFGQQLRHLGNFDQWNLSKNDRLQIVDDFRAQNYGIVLEEHLKAKTGEAKTDFSQRFVEHRLQFSCQDAKSLLSDHFEDKHHDFLDLFDVIAGLHGFMEGNGNDGNDDSDSDDSIMESDDGDDVFVDEPMVGWMDEDFVQL